MASNWVYSRSESFSLDTASSIVLYYYYEQLYEFLSSSEFDELAGFYSATFLSAKYSLPLMNYVVLDKSPKDSPINRSGLKRVLIVDK